jgi:methyltransferase-like protein/2-polyprenyl-3-methyl-5-hydroxy-6-metoxy-1,4-benzoquinol methylase
MPTAYDVVDYPSHCLPQTHPNRLGALATLFGLSPEGETCRVLEIGCGDGLNLLAIAVAMPQSRCVGIDLAMNVVERGLELVRRVGARNISLQCIDLAQITAEFGQFDYIIAHGVYSWVPSALRDALLEVCRQNLTPQGVAYVSYNSNPGGHLRQMFRHMMRYHVRHLTEPARRVAEARNLLKVLADAHQRDHPIGLLLRGEFERLKSVPDAQMFHDDLADINEPVYFDQFVAHAAAHDLQFLAEAELELISAEGMPQWVQAELARVAGTDVVARELYMDFFRDRTFRQTLLCHAACKLDRPPRPTSVRKLHVASSARPVSAVPQLQTSKVESFKGPTGAEVSTNNPLAKAAMVALSQRWPGSITFDELFNTAKEGAQVRADEADADHLAQIMLSLCAGGLVEFHSRPLPFVAAPAHRPLASPLARAQAAGPGLLTTLNGTSIRFEGSLARKLVQLLDGTRDGAAILSALPGTSPQQLASKLVDLGRLGLLVH